MMTDKSQQFVGEKIGKPYSREWIEENYPFKILTDEQWEIFKDYMDSADDEEEFEEEWLFAFYKIEELVEMYKAYDKAWLEAHGNAYPFDENGRNTLEEED
jgi:hypothetical protein